MDHFDFLRETILFPTDEISGMLTEYSETFDDPIKKDEFQTLLGRKLFFLEMSKAITEMVILVSSATSVKEDADFLEVLKRVKEEKNSDTEHMKLLRDFHVKHLGVVKKNAQSYLIDESYNVFCDRLDQITSEWFA